MKIFISQPFHQRSEEDIMRERQRAINFVDYRLNGFKTWKDRVEIEVIDNYNKIAPDGADRLWYLGDSIRLMDEADLVVFVPGWTKAKGCRIEHTVALSYEKKIMHIEEFHR